MRKVKDTMAMIVDYQERMMPVIHRNEEIIKNATILIKGLKALDVPMMITQQYTKGLGMTVAPIFAAAETENYFEKMTFSSFRDEKTAAQIRNHQRKNVIVCGVEAHICVLQTCLDLKENGYAPILVLDCIGSRKQSNVEMTITRAIQEGITVTSYESILFELMERADIEAFRTVSKLVR
ncbi:MAG: isochorismatase family protein [Lachnospiraceae bacterium]|nr:isochorismatase family protein [Lachnospiraceae bacterium]